MNNIITKILAVVIFALAMASCSTSQKVSIYGTPGEKIYTSGKDLIGTIPASGELKIRMDDDDYTCFMLSTKPGEEDYIPFALNYKYAPHYGARFSKHAGLTITCLGVTTAVIGGIVAIVDGGESVIPAVGGGLCAVGAGIGIPGSVRCTQDAYEYKYKYLSSQATNGNFVFTHPKIEYVDFEKKKAVEQPKLRPRKQTEKQVAAPKQATQKARKSLGDYAKKAEGTYVGTGVISLDGEDIEELHGLTVEIKRTGSNEVSINIIESDGNDFFGVPTKYAVSKGSKKNGKGSVDLTHKTIPSAIITIREDELVYLNPKVEIDGTVYTLNISAEKQ